jgi:hypothetical protein
LDMEIKHARALALEAGDFTESMRLYRERRQPRV